MLYFQGLGRSFASVVAALGCLAAAGASLWGGLAWSQENKPGEVDTALVVSVDVSNSVDQHRYQLQMQGIATALEDPEVLEAILSGGKGGILFTLVTWADKPKTAIPWMRIASKEEAAAAADKVRQVPQQTGEFTCMGLMLRHLADKVVTQIPLPATRVVIDVSGDGSDNCNPLEPVKSVRDELVGYNVTINGLPILEGREAGTLEAYYKENVMGGGGAFVLPAEGFGDFGRAIRQKFVVEVSGIAPPRRYADSLAPTSR
jgi:hypothetical protein